MSSRNLDVFNEVTELLYVPIKDVQIEDLDEIDCRIIRFGKKNTINWKPRLNKQGVLEEQKPTDHIRLYLYVYEFRKAKNRLAPNVELSEKFITINPAIKWLSDLKALQISLSEGTGDAERIFKHKITIRRVKGSFVAKGDGQTIEYAFLKFQDNGPDINYQDNENENLASADEDSIHESVHTHESDNRETTIKAPRVESSDQSAQQSNVTQQPTKQSEEIAARIKAAFEASDSIEEMTALAKGFMDKTSNKEVQDKIIVIFNKVKAAKLSDMVIESGDHTKFYARAEELASKYIKQDNVQMKSDLLAYARIMIDAKKQESAKQATKYNTDEDIPF